MNDIFNNCFYKIKTKIKESLSHFKCK
jgi:hypothetical protein